MHPPHIWRTRRSAEERMSGDYLEAQRREVMHRRLYDRVMETLRSHDPLGLAAARPDEYTPEVNTILPRLADADSEPVVRRIVYEEFVRWRTQAVAGVEERYTGVARDVWSAVQAGRA
jgi:hypothetical protein